MKTGLTAGAKATLCQPVPKAHAARTSPPSLAVPIRSFTWSPARPRTRKRSTCAGPIRPRATSCSATAVAPAAPRSASTPSSRLPIRRPKRAVPAKTSAMSVRTSLAPKAPPGCPLAIEIETLPAPAETSLRTTQ